MHPSISDLKQDYEIYVFIIPFYRWENWGDRRSSFSLKVTELGRWHGQDVFEPEVSYGLKPLHFSPADLWCLKSPHKCWLLGSSEREKGRLKMTPNPWVHGMLEECQYQQTHWNERNHMCTQTHRCAVLSRVSCVQLFAAPWTVSSLSISSVHGILQARILEWIAMPSSRGSSWLKDWTRISYASCIDRWALYH